MTIRPCIVVGLLIGAFAHGAVADDSKFWKRFNAKDGSFSIYFPTKWTVSKDKPGGAVLAVSSVNPPRGRYGERVAVSRVQVDRRLTFEQVWAGLEQDVSKKSPNYKFVSKARIRIDGLPAGRLTYTREMSNHNVTMSQFFVLSNGTFYTVSCVCDRDGFEKNKKLLTYIAMSLDLHR